MSLKRRLPQLNRFQNFWHKRFHVQTAGSTLTAQQPGVHYWQHGDMPPGAIGALQLTRGGPLPGHFQPVEIRAPQGARISLARENAFDRPTPGPAGHRVAGGGPRSVHRQTL